MDADVTRVAAVILAGGRGERLGGVVKAGLVVAGRRLLDRVADALSSADEILVSHGRIDPDGLGLAAGHIAVPDLDSDYGGPLAGLAGAVAWAQLQPDRPDILVLAPVDSPFLPPDYVPRLLAGLASSPAAIATYDGQPYPTSSAWSFDAVADLPRRVSEGTAPHSLRRLAASLGAAAVAFPAYAGGDPFANANTPDELLALQRRADLA